MSRLTRVESERRDHKVAQLLKEGKSNQEIAAELGISKGSIYAVVARAKKISGGDLSLSEQSYQTEKKLRELEAKHNELLEAIRAVDAVDAVRDGLKAVRKRKLDKERQEQIEAINEKYDRMIESDDFFNGEAA